MNVGDKVRLHYYRGKKNHSKFPVEADGMFATIIRINRAGRPVVLPDEWCNGFEFPINPKFDIWC